MSCVCVCVCAQTLSHVQFFATLWTVSPGSSVHGILPARTLEWVAISSYWGFSWPRDWTHASCVPCIADSLPLSHQGSPHKIMLLLLLLSRFSRVRLCATPEMAAHQAPPSLGFSRQEHWSGLPFPPPMHESEKWKWSLSVMSDSDRPHGLQPTRLFRPWDFPGKSTGVGCHCLLRHKIIKRTNSDSYHLRQVHKSHFKEL